MYSSGMDQPTVRRVVLSLEWARCRPSPPSSQNQMTEPSCITASIVPCPMRRPPVRISTRVPGVRSSQPDSAAWAAWFSAAGVTSDARSPSEDEGCCRRTYILVPLGVVWFENEAVRPGDTQAPGRTAGL